MVENMNSKHSPTSINSDAEPTVCVEGNPYFRQNSELSSRDKKTGKKIAEKKGGYIEGSINLGRLSEQVSGKIEYVSSYLSFNVDDAHVQLYKYID